MNLEIFHWKPFTLAILLQIIKVCTRCCCDLFLLFNVLTVIMLSMLFIYSYLLGCFSGIRVILWLLYLADTQLQHDSYNSHAMIYRDEPTGHARICSKPVRQCGGAICTTKRLIKSFSDYDFMLLTEDHLCEYTGDTVLLHVVMCSISNRMFATL